MRLVSTDTLAALTLWMEAEGEPDAGLRAVGEVIRRRMALRYASDGTVEGTVLRRHQFSGWNENEGRLLPALCLDDADPEFQRCLRAWRDSARSREAGLADHYLNPQTARPLPSWARDPHDPNQVDATLVTRVIARHTFLRLVT